MAIEQALYGKVVMLCRKYLKIIEENKNKNEDKFKFQSQSTRSQSWSNLDFDWITESFSTCGPDFYKEIFQRHDETQYKNTFKMFVVPITNAKNVEEMKFHINSPILKYRQSTSNSCCFSSLVSYFDIINQIKASNAMSKCIEESFKSQVSFRNRIDSASTVLKNQKIIKGEQVYCIIS